MRLPLQIFRSAAFVLCLPLVANTSKAAEVPNLGAVPAAIAHTEGREAYAEEMGGTSRPRGFGELPAGLDAPGFVRGIAPEEDPVLVVFTGAKAWGGDGLFLGAACFALNAGNAEEAKGDTSCTEGKLYLGVFRLREGAPEFTARTAGPLNAGVSWSNSELEAPQAADETLGGEHEALPRLYTKFDTAPYRLAPGVMAFGVRAGFRESYSGGGAYFEALQLFVMKGDRIVNILSEPMYFYSDTAGEWHEDGTRSHTVTEGKNILKVLDTRTDGYADLQIAGVGSGWKKTFVWSAARERYVPKSGKE